MKYPRLPVNQKKRAAPEVNRLVRSVVSVHNSDMKVEANAVKVGQSGKYIGIAAGAILIVAFVGFLGYRYYLAQKELAALKSGGIIANSEQAQEEVKKTIAAVDKLLVLPNDEQPTVATVSDVDKLKNQPFFTNAQNGDKVLIYSNAKKAILYRPSVNKIIEIAPVNIGTPSASAQSVEVAPSPTAKQLRLVVRNGTSVTGLTRSFEEEVKDKVPNVLVIERGNANKSDYDISLIIDVAGTRKAEAEEIARAMNLTVSQLPEAEPAPSADFLVILGSDRR